MADLPPSFWEDLQAIYKKEDHDDLTAFEAERPTLESAFTLISAEIPKNYAIIKPLGRGGAGIVVQLRDSQLLVNRALKVPRPRNPELVESVRNEIDHLKQLHHDNLIGIYELGEVPVAQYKSPYPYFVMDFVEDVSTLRTKIEHLLSLAKTPKDLKPISRWLAEKLFGVARALDYLHEQNTIHFDVKPSNILINIDSKPILTDLGFAKRKTEDQKPTVVGFTLFYAHPDLRAEYQHMTSQNRVRKPLAPRDFRYVWDIYAFGKAILEILSLIDLQFPDSVSYDYYFTYLHLAACRMLDGHNLSKEDTDAIRSRQASHGDPVSTYLETWLNLSRIELATVAYKSFGEIKADLAILLDDRHYGQSVPELNIFHKDRVQVSAGSAAPFSARVKAVIEHPCFYRLSSVLQLGLAPSVYPGATHTRFEHSIGAFRNCCAYLQALYNDPYNPLFRQLVSEEDIRCTLVASLVHDLGQYPLAHDLGELDSAFKHERRTAQWLKNTTVDKLGRTLREIIENHDYGWGVPLDKIEQLIGTGEDGPNLYPSTDLKAAMLSSIIDGPIDVDKTDYLVRDSQKAFLPYGRLIDVDRLIRYLTVIISKDDEDGDKTIVTIGTYEGGQSAAESITFARYLLYQSLYWHHTLRAARTMLREAAIAALHSKHRNRPFISALDKMLGLADTKGPVFVTNEMVLDLIAEWTNASGKGLVAMIKARNYYKRILTIHNYGEEEGRPSLLEQFRENHRKPGFAARLQELIRKHLEEYLSGTSGPASSALGPEIRSEVLELLGQPGKILCDCPNPQYGSRQKLRFIPAPQRLRQNYLPRIDVGDRVSEVWQQVFFKLMGIASKGRVFCDPRVRGTIMAALGPDCILRSVRAVVREFGGEEGPRIEGWGETR